MNSKGQALLPLLIVIVIVLSLGTAAVEVSLGNILADRYHQEEIFGYYTAESALENAFLRLLRQPDYAGESLQINGASCTITVSGDPVNQLTVLCENGQWMRKLQAQLSYSQGVMTVDQIQEIE